MPAEPEAEAVTVDGEGRVGDGPPASPPPVPLAAEGDDRGDDSDEEGVVRAGAGRDELCGAGRDVVDPGGGPGGVMRSMRPLASLVASSRNCGAAISPIIRAIPSWLCRWVLPRSTSLGRSWVRVRKAPTGAKTKMSRAVSRGLRSSVTAATYRPEAVTLDSASAGLHYQQVALNVVGKIVGHAAGDEPQGRTHPLGADNDQVGLHIVGHLG